MIAIYLLPIFIMVCAYILWRFFGWLKSISPIFEKRQVLIPISIVYFIIALSPYYGFFFKDGTLKKIIMHIANCWLGGLIYLLMILIVFELVRFFVSRKKKKSENPSFSKKSKIISGAVCIFLTLAISIGGIINSNIIRTTSYDIEINKTGGNVSSLKIALIADLHLGYNKGCMMMKKARDIINSMNADIVVFAGDIFDNRYEALDDPDELTTIIKGIKSTYGMYACYGNHDISEDLICGFTVDFDAPKESSDEMDDFLKECGIVLLRDEYRIIDDSFYLFGRPDLQKPGKNIETRMNPDEITSDMDKSKPIIIIDHQPKELTELAEAGVDIDLSGHTHKGQIFPLTLSSPIMWENCAGCIQINNMYSIVTEGIGVYGPNMRVGCKPEICEINVNFADNLK